MTDVSLAGAGPGVLDPTGPDEPDESSVLAVFRNRPFLLLWLSQAFTQIGGNMVIYGLTVIILEATRSNTAVSILILTFRRLRAEDGCCSWTRAAGPVADPCRDR